MSRILHPNQLPVMLAEQDDYEDDMEPRSVKRALRFLEGMDYEDDSLRLRRRRQARLAS